MGAAENTDIVVALKGDHSTIEKHLLAVTEAVEADRPAVFRALVELLVRHEVAEEVVVYPAIRDMPGGDSVADARIAEQAEAESRLAELERFRPDTTEFASTFSQLRKSVLEHTALEEEHVFPLLERAPEETRGRLGDRYASARSSAPTHPHPSAPDTPPGNRLAGPVASLFDRMRDFTTNG